MAALPDLDELLLETTPAKAAAPTSAFDAVLAALGRRVDTPEARRIPLPVPSAGGKAMRLQDGEEAPDFDVVGDPGSAAVLAALRDLPSRPIAGGGAEADGLEGGSASNDQQYELSLISRSFKRAVESEEALLDDEGSGGGGCDVASFQAASEADNYTATLWAAVLDGVTTLPPPPSSVAQSITIEVATSSASTNTATTTTRRVTEERTSISEEQAPASSAKQLLPGSRRAAANDDGGGDANDDEKDGAVEDTRQLRAAMKQAARGRVAAVSAARVAAS
jgi:hypothetical protein